jgi:hypothetical protein
LSGLWNKPGVPQRGWRCVDVTDLGEAIGTCQMCDREEIRFVHHMEHNAYPGTLGVGCVCAGKMSSDYVGARNREKKLKSKAGRKARWLARRWKIARSGNPYLNVDGYNIVVFRYAKGRNAGRWGYKVGGTFGTDTYETEGAAKLAAFEGYWLVSQDRDD